MKSHFLILFLFVAVACTSNQQKSLDPEQNTQLPATIDSNLTTTDEKELFVSRGSYENEQYKVVAFSHYLIPKNIVRDSSYYHKENILSLTNKNTTRTYIIKIADPCSDKAEIIINNVTNTLGFKDPLFEITTPDCSDWYLSEFIQLKGDTLQNLFAISDSEPTKLAKTKENTLTGTVKDRDELIGNFQEYPITVSLVDYSVRITKPRRQKIDFESEALEEIRGYWISNNSEKKPYVIREGQRIIINSLFRDTKEVLLIVQDSILVICPVSGVKGKLQGNTAG